MNELQKKRAELKAKLAALVALKTAAKAAGAADEAKTAYKTALDEIDAISLQIDELEQEERIEGLGAKSAGSTSGGAAADEEGEGDVYWAQVKTEDKPEFEVGLVAAAHAKAKALHQSGIQADTIKVLRQEGFDRFADQVLAKQARRAKMEGRVVKSNSTLTPQDGGVLVPTPNNASILPLLRAENTFVASGPRRIPLVGGRYFQPIQTGSASAGYVGEGAKKPVGSPTFGAIDMTSKKIAGIVLLTEEVLRWSLPDIRAFVQDDLRQTIAQNMDTALYFGAGTATVPWGIFQREAYINTFDASATGAEAWFANPLRPTVEELDLLASAMMLAITNRNIVASDRFQWSMNYNLLQFLKTRRTPNDTFVYPELHSETPRWWGFRVRPTNAIPNNGGETMDESILALVDWSNVWFGEEEVLTVKTSSEATIDVGTGVLVHTFQQNMTALLMEARHDCALQRPGAISVLKHARWGALAG